MNDRRRALLEHTVSQWALSSWSTIDILWIILAAAVISLSASSVGVLTTLP